jgi:hypothetical protein
VCVKFVSAITMPICGALPVSKRVFGGLLRELASGPGPTPLPAENRNSATALILRGSRAAAPLMPVGLLKCPCLRTSLREVDAVAR